MRLEHFSFWLLVEQYKRLKVSETRTKLGKMIYKRFLKEKAKGQILRNYQDLIDDVSIKMNQSVFSRRDVFDRLLDVLVRRFRQMNYVDFLYYTAHACLQANKMICLNIRRHSDSDSKIRSISATSVRPLTKNASSSKLRKRFSATPKSHSGICDRPRSPKLLRKCKNRAISGTLRLSPRGRRFGSTENIISSQDSPMSSGSEFTDSESSYDGKSFFIEDWNNATPENHMFHMPHLVFSGFKKVIFSSKWRTEQGKSTNNTTLYSRALPNGVEGGMDAEFRVCYRADTTVNVPADKLIDFLSNVEHMKEWDANIDTVTIVKEISVEKSSSTFIHVLKIKYKLPNLIPVEDDELAQARHVDDLYVLRVIGTYKTARVCIMRSVKWNGEEPDLLLSPRLAQYLSGFYVLPGSENRHTTSRVYTLSCIVGTEFPEQVEFMNQAVINRAERLAEFITKTNNLAGKFTGDILFKFVTPPYAFCAQYSCSCKWNPPLSAMKIDSPSSSSSLLPRQQTVGSVMRILSPRVATKKRISDRRRNKQLRPLQFVKGDVVLVLSEGDKSKEIPWIGYITASGNVGSIDLSYFKLIPKRIERSSIILQPFIIRNFYVHQPQHHKFSISPRRLSSPKQVKLKSGFGADDEGTCYTATTDLPSYDSLIEILCSSSLELVTVLCDVNAGHADFVAVCFLYILRSSPERIIPLLITLVSRRIKSMPSSTSVNDEQSSTLFRGTDVISLVIPAFCSMLGRTYLQKVLTSIIELITKTFKGERKKEESANDHGNPYEIDPSRLIRSSERGKDAVSGDELAENNVANLTYLCDFVLSKIVDNLKYLPRPFLMLCGAMDDEVQKTFSGASHIVLAGFFFLRFLCPALVSPHAYGFTMEEIPKEVRRALILVSKVLQNLASGVKFGFKEQHMLPMNRFITKNQPRAADILEKITTPIVHEDALRFADVDELSKINLDTLTPLLIYIHTLTCCNIVQVEEKMNAVVEMEVAGSGKWRTSNQLFLELLHTLMDMGSCASWDYASSIVESLAPQMNHAGGPSKHDEFLKCLKKWSKICMKNRT